MKLDDVERQELKEYIEERYVPYFLELYESAYLYFKNRTSSSLYRGYRKPIKEMEFFYYPSNRKPKDSEPFENELFKLAVEQKYRLRNVRERAAFLTQSIVQASQYGEVYEVFPTDDTLFLISTEIEDLVDASYDSPVVKDALERADIFVDDYIDSYGGIPSNKAKELAQRLYKESPQFRQYIDSYHLFGVSDIAKLASLPYNEVIAFSDSSSAGYYMIDRDFIRKAFRDMSVYYGQQITWQNSFETVERIWKQDGNL